MSHRRAPWFATGLIAIVVPAGAAAQQLETGTWTGTVTPPGNETVDATFDVRLAGDTIAITLKVQFGDFPFSNIELSGNRLTFTFSPGTPVNCVLVRQDNDNYSGDCTDQDGEVGVIVMIPPAGSAAWNGGRAVTFSARREYQRRMLPAAEADFRPPGSPPIAW